MEQKVRCPVCAKSVRDAPGDATRQVICQACGHRFESRPGLLLQPLAGRPLANGRAIAAAATADEPATGAGRDPALDADRTFVPAFEGSAPRINGNAHSNGHDATAGRAGAGAGAGVGVGQAHPLWYALCGILACGAVVIGVLAVAGRLNAWEDDNRIAVVALRNKAEGQAASGDLRRALGAYHELDALVAGRSIRDPDLRAMIDAARAERQQVNAIVMAQMMEAARLRAAATREGAGPVAGPTATPSPTTTAPAAPRPAVAVVPPPVPPASADSDNAIAGTPKPTAVSNPAVTRPAPTPVAARPAVAATRPARPALLPVPPARDVLTDAQIGQSIQKGVDFLLGRIDRDRGILTEFDPTTEEHAQYAGRHALVVYALLQSAQAIDDPRLNVGGATMRQLIDVAKRLPMDGHKQTYARALRSTMLAVHNRNEDYGTLRDDADFLVGTVDDGAYSYAGPYRPARQRAAQGFGRYEGSWDNSNSQYGLLGVWSAADADARIDVPPEYWRSVERHWARTQAENGQWSYSTVGGRDGTLSMTCAGLASMFVAHEYLTPPMSSTLIGRPPHGPAVRKGLAWFEKGDHAITARGGHWWGYTLYGIERVGLASGFKHFGAHDWYRTLAAEVVSSQTKDGSWGADPIVDSAYALLFLARGRHPILMNKLRFDRGEDPSGVGITPGGYWSNRPRDAANLARFASRQLERPINWQVVNLDNPWTDWGDSPVLYIASHEPPAFADADYEKLRQFSRAGGLIFTHADGSSPTFDAWAFALAERLFPKYPMEDIPAGHPLFSALFKPTPRPPVRGVSNGSRLLMVHAPQELAVRWQNREDRIYEGRGAGGAAGGPDRKDPDPVAKAQRLAPFHFGLNLFVYAAGKRDLRNRIDSTYVAPVPPTAKPVGETIAVARLSHGGNWDPEPGAWERYLNWFRRATGTRLEADVVPLAELRPTAVALYPMAHLTGTAAHAFARAEATALREYVEAGGVVLIDACGGVPGAFEQSVREGLLREAFPSAIPQALAGGHPLLSAGAAGMEDVARPRVRPYVIERRGTGNAGGPLMAIRAGRGHVLYTGMDITSGLLGTNTWGIMGYEPAYAQALLKNVLFWTVDGQPGR